MAVADFNADGKLDYVTAQDGNNSTTIGIALGNGDGTFKTPSTIAVACGAVWVATGDFNGDGKTDLAVASRDCSPGTNGVSIFLGNGDGTFTAKGTLTSPLANPASIAVGDFSGDGKIDLAVVDRGASTDSVFFYFGNGDGTFQAPVGVSLGVSVAANQIVAADFNKDGHLDVAVSEINGSNVVVIISNGNGTFQAPRTNALPAQGWGLAVGDLNGDGIPDLVATTPSNGGVTVFLGKGDGNFTPVNNPVSGTLPTANAAVPGGGCTAIAVGDFNKDGKLDIAAGLSGVNTAALVAVLAGNGDGTFAPERLFGVADTPQSIAVGDFNGDGNLDWIASTGQINSANQGSVTVALGRGDGTFLATESYVGGQGPSWAAEADFNKDGKLDVVVPNQPSQNISIFLGKGDGTLQPATNIAFPALNPSFVVTGDFNNDGNPDFVVFSNWCPNFVNAPVFAYLGKGDGTFRSPVSSNISGLSSCGSLSVMVAGDFNGDGKLDIGMLLTNNSGPLIAVMLGNGDGTFQAPVTTPAPGGRATWMSVGDLNKDGKLDAVVVQYMSNELQVFLGNGDGSFQAPTTLATGRLPGSSVLADFNGDGNLDIFVENQQDLNAEIFLGNGNGTFNSPSIVNITPTNSPASIKVVGDFNLDGHLDVLFGHNDNRGTGISLLLGNGDGTFQPVQNYLVSGFSGVTAVGDFNGDGAPDALLVDTNEEFVSILLNQTPPPIAVSPSSLGFGNQLVGTTSSALTVKVSNNGSTATTISITASGDFAQTNNCPVSPATLAPAASCNISVTFTPTATGVRNGAVTVSDPLPGSPQTVALSGTGVAPIVTLSGTSLGFGNQIVGTSSAAQMVTLSNTGTATLTISSIAITGTNSGDFSQTNTCGASVAAGANCSISVTFKPTATGARAASVTITDNASGSPQSISLSGTGVAPVVSFGGTTSLTFSGQPVGTSSAAQSVILTNTGNAALTINSIAITGTNSSDFSETSTCPASPSTLAAGANCSIAVTFKPTATGTRNASLSVTDDASGSPQSVSLTGTGVPAAPVVSLSPTSLSFGNQFVGTSSASQSVTLTNTGNATLSFSGSGITITGTNSGDFSQTNTCGASVAASANCTITVIFKPSATGARSAAVSITDNAAGSPQSVALTGTGTAPIVSFGGTTSLNFNNQLVGSTSASQTVTLTNTGTATLTISGSGISITGANSGDFAETNTCGSSVAAGANCTISVTFKPTATGARNASLSVTDNASGSPQSIPLTGTGVAPAVTLSPTSLTFAGQLITTASSVQSVTLTNSGTSPLTISSITVTGTNASDFAQTNTCPASSSTLAVNANCSISVTFTPAATGSRTASVSIADNASGSPHTFSLMGTGTDYSLAAASGANCPSGGNCSTSATISAGSTATYDLQVTPSNGFNGNVALACSGAPGASTCTVSPASVPPAGSASYAFTVTVGNTANVMFVPPPQPPFHGLPGLPSSYSLLIFAVILFAYWMARGRSERFARRCLVPAMAVFFFCVLYTAGCGGGGGGGGPQPPTNAVLKVTGTSSGVNRTVSLNLTVNH
ncbi:MAG TPA: choice-of-anchor D domain-containing protein [Candidatus Acidoferrum sp.]